LQLDLNKVRLVLANHVFDCQQENFFNAWYKPGTSQAYCIDPIPTGTPFAGTIRGTSRRRMAFGEL